MQLPPALQRAIDEELAAHNPAQLRAAASRLSQCYRQASDGASAGAPYLPSLGRRGSGSGGPLSDDLHRAAYLAVRMPATYASVVSALGWTRQACGEAWSEDEALSETGGEASGDRIGDPITTMLDLGSGPGTALWAAAQLFPTLRSATAIERDPRLIEIARRLAGHAPAGQSEDELLRRVTWLQGDLKSALPQGRWDLVVCSYVLNELAEAPRAELIRQAWARTAKLLVLVEPGTRAGFANVLEARNSLLASGATLAAPCPNSLACPMSEGGDWCHFAARVERTAGHRRLKEATLGYEDEKFSYVAFIRTPLTRIALENELQLPPSRIVRHPRIFSGHTQLTLCREGQIAATTVTRAQKEAWRRLKRLGWGDSW